MNPSSTPIKLLLDGTEIPASDPRTDHVAVLFPDTGIIVATTLTSDDGEEISPGTRIDDEVAKTNLLGRTDWINAPLDEVLLRHVIRHDRICPAVDTNLFPNFPKYGWIFSSTAVPGSPARAFSVFLFNGGVNDFDRSGSGFGLACCRARQ